MTPAKKHRTGFAMVTALFLISFTAMALTVLSVTIFSQARRAQLASEDAELRQLLLAGTKIAQSQLQSQTPPQIILPHSLREQCAELTIKIDYISPTQNSAEIQASLPHHHLLQKVIFEYQQNTWRPTSASIQPSQ